MRSVCEQQLTAREAVCAATQIIRVFDAPQSFLRQLQHAGAARTALADRDDGVDTVTRVVKAYVPELGLSNKVCCGWLMRPRGRADRRRCHGLTWLPCRALQGILATGEGRGTMHPLAAGMDDDAADGSGAAAGAVAGEGEGDGDEAGASVRPPLEEDLVDHTVWPESQKLYGHGYVHNSSTHQPSASLRTRSHGTHTRRPYDAAATSSSVLPRVAAVA